MIEIDNKVNCSGCSACKNICPQNAISMVEDEYGFKYPNINYNLCINCGLCDKACPIINFKKEHEISVNAYAVINKNEKIRMESSSGGIFTLIAENIINKGGVVFGAKFNENFLVEHSKAERIEELSEFRGSKYIQSDINKTFIEAKRYLNQGRKVLFTGTPCQIEGLKSFLMKDYENLYTQDLICHGVPSKKVWNKYLEYRKEKDFEIPEKISFRNKENNGWNKYELLFQYKNFNQYIDHSEDLFMKIFLSDIALRDSCYDCKFKKKYRVSDFTLADFWGINNVLPEMNDEKGTSLVFVNSQKAKLLLEEIKDKIILEEINIDDAIKYNLSAIKSSKYDINRKKFFEDLDNEDIEILINRYIEKNRENTML